MLRRLVEHFVQPPGRPGPAAHEDFVPPDEGPDRACAEPAPRTPPGIAVLAPAPDAHSLGAALGLALASRRRAPVVVVCVWTPGRTSRSGVARAGDRPPRAASPRRSARAGTTRAPPGRLAVVRLPEAPEQAAVEARRAAPRRATAPTVLALGGPRVAAFDELLAEQDLVVVATPSGTDPALARLALAGLASGAARTCACEVPPAHPARTVAAAGLTLLPSARRALAVPVEALS